MSAAMHGQESRVIHYAVLASIVLHGLMLFSFSMKDASRRTAAAPGPIVARLVQPQAAPAKPEAVAPPRVAEPQPPAVKPTPSPKSPPVAKAAPKALAQPAAPAPAPSAAEPAPAPPSAAPALGAAAPQSAAPAARPGTDVDADSLGRFRMQVIEAAIKFKRYPRAAMDNNWEGRADVRVTFGADGRRASIVIVRSSGHEILDKQALDTVTKAFVPVPPSLRGKEFAFEIPVIFNLKDNPSG